MPRLNATGLKTLKIFHLLFICFWIGGATAIPAMKLGLHPDTAPMLYQFDLARKFVDDWIVIPGAVGCLATGLVYSLFTGYGFFKVRWVAVKWVVTLFGIIFGTFWLGPWLNALPPLSKQLGLTALNDPAYLRAGGLNFGWGLVQLATVVFALVISVVKPWRGKGASRGQA